MYISTTPTTNKLFRLPTQNKQTTVQSFKLIPTNDTVHSFNVKPIKMLSDPVAEAFGLIHRHPSGENFWCVRKQSLDKPLKWNTPITEPRYRFDKSNDDLLHNTLKDNLTNIDTNITTQDELEELAVILCDKLMKVVDTSTPKVYSRNDPKSPISQAILDLIKEKRRLRRLYNNTQDTNIKSTIDKLQKEIRTKVNQESTLSWEKFCNSISLESDPKKSWRKITNFLEPKGPRCYPTLKLGNKTAKTNPEKAQLFCRKRRKKLRH